MKGKVLLNSNKQFVFLTETDINYFLDQSCLVFSAQLIWPKIGSGIHRDRDQIFYIFFVINLLSFYRALFVGSISLLVEYQNTNLVLSRELDFTVSRCTLFTVFNVLVFSGDFVYLVQGTFLSGPSFENFSQEHVLGRVFFFFIFVFSEKKVLKINLKKKIIKFFRKESHFLLLFIDIIIFNM